MLKLEKLKLKLKNLKLKDWNLKTKKAKISLVVVALVALVVIFNWQRFSAFAQSVVDTFTSTDRVADQWNVVVDTGTGEVKLAEKTCDDANWFCSANNVCINSLGDGNNIIVKRTNETNAQWKITQTDCNQPECGQDEGQYGDNLVADNTVNFGATYPARQACKDVGGRLPTISELQCIYTNRAAFGDNFGASRYWSATEDFSTNARGINFSTGSVYNDSKTTTYSVRCVRGW